ncbi:MAG: hypothetical protein EBZ85_01670 [Actinobacteria bacterium]|nr:hypothetical protein [Actinomycetota bacterium]
MSGHSKWATIKRKKAAIDSKRSQAFAKYIKAIEVAARNGCADPDGNPTLFDAIAKAKKNSVPGDNIDRALKRASGAEAGSANWETIMYEGYGPGGVALLVPIRESLQRAHIDYESADSSFLPTVSVPVVGEIAKNVITLVDAIEELDDVQNVYGNFDISDEVLASLT